MESENSCCSEKIGLTKRTTRHVDIKASPTTAIIATIAIATVVTSHGADLSDVRFAKFKNYLPIFHHDKRDWLTTYEVSTFNFQLQLFTLFLFRSV